MGFGGNGGGGGSISGSSDVALNNVTNSQVLTYNQTTGKWANAAALEGPQGPQGEPGLGFDTGVAQLAVLQVMHGANAATARPSVPNPVYWIGTVQPSHMDEAKGDVWWELDTTAPATQYALDGLTAPHRALSLRRLLSSYTGSLIRVRRASDNAEQDIGFDGNGALDTAALTSFVSSGNAYVTTWYDQSGNARNMTQSTTAAQPAIVVSGAVVTLSGKPAVSFDGTDDYLTSASTGLYTTGSSSVAFVGSAAQSGSATVFGEIGQTSSDSYRLLRIGSGSASPVLRASVTANSSSVWLANASAGDTTFNGAQKQVFLVDSGSVVNAWTNGTQNMSDVTATRGAAPAVARTSLGATAYNTPAGFITGSVQELVVWSSNTTSSRATFSSNQQSYWGVQ